MRDNKQITMNRCFASGHRTTRAISIFLYTTIKNVKKVLSEHIKLSVHVVLLTIVICFVPTLSFATPDNNNSKSAAYELEIEQTGNFSINASDDPQDWIKCYFSGSGQLRTRVHPLAGCDGNHLMWIIRDNDDDPGTIMDFAYAGAQEYSDWIDISAGWYYLQIDYSGGQAENDYYQATFYYTPSPQPFTVTNVSIDIDPEDPQTISQGDMVTGDGTITGTGSGTVEYYWMIRKPGGVFEAASSLLSTQMTNGSATIPSFNNFPTSDIGQYKTWVRIQSPNGPDDSLSNEKYYTVIGPQLPNDDCSNAEPVSDVTNLAFNTTEATFDGPGLCMTSPNIWYCYTATCTGTATVSLCGSGYDTKLAVYDGCQANPTASRLIECNDDYCGLQSQITFDVTAGNQFLIEVGGYQQTTGQGVLSISCEGLPGPQLPTISRNPTQLSPSCEQGQNASSDSFEVWNSGSGTLNYTISDDADDWLSCTPSSGSSTGEHDTIDVTYSTSGLSEGSYSATITISDPAATNDPQTISVNLTVEPQVITATLSGIVFEDKNENGNYDAGEEIANALVGTDQGVTPVISGPEGLYILTNLTPSLLRLEVVIDGMTYAYRYDHLEVGENEYDIQVNRSANDSFNLCSADMVCRTALAGTVMYLGKPADMAGVAAGWCGAKQRLDQGDMLGSIMGSVVSAIDTVWLVGEEILDITGISSLPAAAVDGILASISCMEGKIWEYANENCGGYSSCLWKGLKWVQRRFIGASTSSPVDIVIVDSQNNLLMLDPNMEGMVINEFSSPAWIFKGDAHKELALVLDPNGDYAVVIVGTEDAGSGDVFDLELFRQLPDGSQMMLTYIDVPISSDGVAIVYVGETINPTLQVDIDGDGSTDVEVQPEAELFVSDANTIALWHLNGNGIDYSGNGNHLTIKTDRVSWIAGKYGHAALMGEDPWSGSCFNSDGAALTAPGSGCTYPGSGDWTVEAWVWWPSNSAGYTAVQHYSKHWAGHDPFRLGVDNGTAKFFITDGSSWIEVSADVSAYVGQWIHIAGVYRYQQDISIFVNGQCEDANSTSLVIENLPSYDVFVGGCYCGTSTGLEVDEVRLSNVARYKHVTYVIGDFCGTDFSPPDGYVDVWDLMQFADSWHSRTGDGNWDAKFDLAGPNLGDSDGYVDIWDLMVFADNWHKGQKP